MVFKRLNGITFKKVMGFFIAILVLALFMTGCATKVDSITLSKDSLELTVNDAVEVTATVSPSDAKDKTVTWSSADPSIATVKDGVITAVAPGETTVTAKAGEKTATVAVKVNAKTYTVTFDSKGGTDVEAKVVVAGEKVAKPEDPVRVNYTFKGWFRDEALTDEFKFDTYPVVKDITLYAKWEGDKLNVTFDSKGGSEVAGVSVEYGTKLTKPADPTKEGYVFSGWFTDTKLTQEYDFNTELTEGIKLYAKWVIAEYDVTFETNGGNSVDAQKVAHNSTVTEPTVTKEGFTLVGWFTDEDLTQAFDFNTGVTANLKLYAKWEVSVYAITFDSNGGSTVEKASVKHNEKVTEPADPTKEGYEFVAWFTDEALTTEYDFNTAVTSAFTLYAKWSFVGKTVEFEFNGGGFSLSQQSELLDVEPLKTLEFKQLDTNYWTFYANNILLYRKGAANVTDPLYAARIGINKNEKGLYVIAQVTKSGEKVVTAVKEFDYLLIAAEGSNATNYSALSSLTVGQIITISGFDINTQAVGEVSGTINVYEANDELNLVTMKLPTDSTLPVPSKVNYTFKGWFENAEFTGEAVTKATKDVKLYAKWAINEYDVVYNTNGGSEVATHKQEHGTKITAPADPTKEGNVFLGWYTDEAMTNLYDFTTEVTGNVTLYAKWASPKETTVNYTSVYNEERQMFYIEVTVTGEDLDKDSIKSISIVKEAGKFVSKDPLTPDTDKVLWFSVAEANGDPSYKESGVYTYLVVKADDSVYAFSFDYDSSNVTGLPSGVMFESNGGSAVDTVFVEKGQPLTRPADPTKLGYEFVAWCTDEALTEEYDFASLEIPTKLYAKWNKITYTITYNLDGGKIRYENQEEMIIDFLTDFHTFLASTEDLNTFMHGEGNTSGFNGTWYDNKAKIYAVGRPTDINNTLFISHEDYMDKWLPFFDFMEEFVIAVNNTQSFYGSTWTGCTRLKEFITGSRTKEGYVAPKGWLNVTSYDVDSDTFYLPEPVKEGTSFLGWYADAEFTGEAVSQVEKGSTGNLVLYAKWEGGSEYVYADTLLISEYIEGSSSNKAIELYNGTGATVDLSEYTLELYSNGKTTITATLTLSGTLEHGKTYVIVNGQANEDFQAKADLVNSDVINFNGDDVVILKKGDAVVDSFGQLGSDPGDFWGDASVSTKDMTLVRKATIRAGRTDASGEFNPSDEWVAFAKDTFANLGSHTTDW